jgi:hypothetical protein
MTSKNIKILRDSASFAFENLFPLSLTLSPHKSERGNAEIATSIFWLFSENPV